MTGDLDKAILVTGHNGMVGSAIVRQLKANGYRNIVTVGRERLDFLDQAAVRQFFSSNIIDEVYIAAAKVGGIYANKAFPADFIYQNLMIEANLIDAAHRSDVQNLLLLGSSCIYPKFAGQPIREDELLTGKLESTNEPYAIAKIAGIKLCESYNRQHLRDYRSVMPTNLYGPNDNFHPRNSHVIPALIRRFHEAVERNDNEVVIWGSGTPRREFLHVHDMAEACVYIMETEKSIYEKYTQPMQSHINVGTGVDCTIAELAESIAEVTGFRGKLTFDTSMPDGTPLKVLDVSRLKDLGWQSRISLKDGLQDTYQWYVSNINALRIK